MTGTSKSFVVSGYLRSKGESDQAVAALAQAAGLL